MYKCEYCNNEFETPLERSQCVLKCYKSQQEKEEEFKRASLRKEKIESRNLIRQKSNELQILIEEYNKKFSDGIKDFSYFATCPNTSLMPNRFPNFEILRIV